SSFTWATSPASRQRGRRHRSTPRGSDRGEGEARIEAGQGTDRRILGYPTTRAALARLRRVSGIPFTGITMSEPGHIDPSQLWPGPIRRDLLPAALLEQIQAVYEVIGPYTKMTLEQFEIGFMRDMHPEGEVAVWCRIAAAWIAYHDKFLNDDR